jgi:hypothetical protein
MPQDDQDYLLRHKEHVPFGAFTVGPIDLTGHAADCELHQATHAMCTAEAMNPDRKLMFACTCGKAPVTVEMATGVCGYMMSADGTLWCNRPRGHDGQHSHTLTALGTYEADELVAGDVKKHPATPPIDISKWFSDWVSVAHCYHISDFEGTPFTFPKAVIVGMLADFAQTILKHPDCTCGRSDAIEYAVQHGIEHDDEEDDDCPVHPR